LIFDKKLNFCVEQFTVNNFSTLIVVEVSALKSIFWPKFLLVEMEHIVPQPALPSQEGKVWVLMTNSCFPAVLEVFIPALIRCKVL